MTRTVLLVEDNEDDILFMQLVWKELGMKHPLQVVKHGQAALDHLAGKGPYADRAAHPLPCLVLLDLQLPYVMGLDVLQWIRGQSSLASLPVLVLTSSGQERDIERAFRLGANAYLEKPNNQDKLREMVQLIRDFWLGISRLPPLVAEGTHHLPIANQKQL